MTRLIRILNRTFFRNRFASSSAHFFVQKQNICISAVLSKKWSDANSTIAPNSLDTLADDEIDQICNVDEQKKVACNLPLGAHSVLVIQPKIVWGPHKPRNTNAQLMLQESSALVQTLPGWRVAGTTMVNVKYDVDHSHVFGSGNVQKLAAQISAADQSATAVFVNVDVLSPVQHSELYSAWKVPIFDRYQIVLLIFKTFAKSKLALLHVAAAEMPYVAARLRELTIGAIPDTFNALDYLGGRGFKLLEERADMFKKRESSVKKALEKARKLRASTNEQLRKQYPVVAVIGYTNSGKTSLVNCLTKSVREKDVESLRPKDRLFATLDCAVYLGQLPGSCLKTYFADTVGFVADIPATLVACFEATLDSIRHASLIVHIRDITHPDAQLQKDTVESTLKRLDLPDELMSRTLEVRNKVDKISSLNNLEADTNRIFNISCLTGQGIERLQHEIDRLVRISDNFVTVPLNVPNGGEEFRFLKDNASISNCETIDEGNRLIVTVTMHDYELKSFFRHYGNLLHRPHSTGNKNR